MTLEERLKLMLGDQIMAIAGLQTHLEAAQKQAADIGSENTKLKAELGELKKSGG